MKHFTRFLCLFFAAAMLLTMAACGSKNTDTDTDTKTGSEKKQLVVATSPDFPPFESLDGSDKLGMELVWEQVDFDSIIPGIQAGRYDAGVAGISITADRLKNCDFSDPYFLANQVIVVNPGSDIQSKADLTGKTIAVQTGTTAETYCLDNGYEILSFASNIDAQAALTSGKADACREDGRGAEPHRAGRGHDQRALRPGLCQGQRPGGPGEPGPEPAAAGRHRGADFPGV